MVALFLCSAAEKIVKKLIGKATGEQLLLGFNIIRLNILLAEKVNLFKLVTGVLRLPIRAHFSVSARDYKFEADNSFPLLSLMFNFYP